MKLIHAKTIFNWIELLHWPFIPNIINSWIVNFLLLLFLLSFFSYDDSRHSMPSLNTFLFSHSLYRDIIYFYFLRESQDNKTLCIILFWFCVQKHVLSRKNIIHTYLIQKSLIRNVLIFLYERPKNSFLRCQRMKICIHDPPTILEIKSHIAKKELMFKICIAWN